MPIALIPSDLTRERQQYLFEQIREYCAEYAKDILCLEPLEKLLEASAAPVSMTTTDETLVQLKRESSPDVLPAPKRKTPTCSYCNEPGHRNQLRNNKALRPKRATDLGLN